MWVEVLCPGFWKSTYEISKKSNHFLKSEYFLTNFYEATNIPIFLAFITVFAWQEIETKYWAYLLDLERSNGEERTESKCRKDKDHDLRYGTGPPAEFRRVSMRFLSHWSGQQQHLLQWLQALVAEEMQWAQALEKGP